MFEVVYLSNVHLYLYIQVACLSVFASLCLHCTTDPAVVSAGSNVFGFMVARAKADLSSVAPDNNVRYMALQALAGLTGVQLQIFLRQAPEVGTFSNTRQL